MEDMGFYVIDNDLEKTISKFIKKIFKKLIFSILL